MNLNDFYNKLPGPLQNLAVTAYGYKVYRREYGKKFEQQMALFEKQAKFSPEEIKAYQSEKLKIVIRHAYDFVPYHRQVMDRLKLTPDDIKSVDDLHKMPIVTKQDVIENFHDMVSTAIKPSQMISGSTSGTTGQPMFLRYDHHCCMIKTVAEWRMKRSLGINVGDKFAFITGRLFVHPDRTKPPFWRKNMILNHLYFSCFHMKKENMKYYIDKLFKFQPLAVEGYPSSMYLIARHMVEEGITYHAKATFTSSETLYPNQLEMIQKAFPGPHYDFYGAAERVAFGTECVERVGKHINLDFGVPEIVDNDMNPVPHGEQGRIVGTGLHNLAMPMIRYRTDDSSGLRYEPCKCGCTFPFMSNVTAKVEDIVATPDGRLIPPSTLSHPIKDIPGIVESQMIQETLYDFQVKLVVNEKFKEEFIAGIIRDIGVRLGSEVAVKVDLVDSIPRTKSGKLRWVISKVGVELPEA